MRTVHLKRWAHTADGTFGRIGPFYTVEEEDQANRSNISRIPAGTYVCKPTVYHRGGYPTFEVTGVPDRSRILFHVANTEEDVQGCIGVGLGLDVLAVNDEDTGERTAKLAITRSKDGFRAFMLDLQDADEFALVVEDV